MSDGGELRDLYQQVILDHYKRPRHFGALPAANRAARGDNPLCGDQIEVALRVEDGRVADVAFTGAGCAISTASASLMTEAVAGKTVAEAEALFARFHRLLTGSAAEAAAELAGDDLGKLVAFGGVREYPVRVKCATLAWHTLRSALQAPGATVTTEESDDERPH
jgi:nitrogen fixation protein NifU and related proteins